MRIAMIGQKGIFVTHDGGVERHVEELSTRLAKLGHEVFVCCRPHYMNAEMRKKLKIENGKLKIRGINLVFKPSINTKFLDTITHVFTSTLHALRQKYDIIHYHGVGPSTLSFIPRIFARKSKVIVTFHSQDRFHQKWGPFSRAFLAFGEWTACTYPHKTIVVSKTLRRYCKERFYHDTIFIPNGVEVKKVSGSDKIKNWGLKEGQYILSVARFVKHKGLHYLIQAFKEFKKTQKHKNTKTQDVKGYKLVLVGESPYPSKYADWLRELAAEDPDIVFTGYQIGEALDQLFLNSYIYVHPSESEGLSITILEAMSYGKCVLISDIEENLEAMEHYGFYFKTGDVGDLKGKLEKLLVSPKIVAEMGEKAREFVKKEHNWDEIAKKTLGVYKSMRTK
jgi:glycosyltransferase involved in cell wall biosynthesis